MNRFVAASQLTDSPGHGRKLPADGVCAIRRARSFPFQLRLNRSVASSVWQPSSPRRASNADGDSVKELGQFWNPTRLVGLWIGMGAAWLVVDRGASNAATALHELAPRWAILAASTALFAGTAVVAMIARIRLARDDRPNERIPIPGGTTRSEQHFGLLARRWFPAHSMADGGRSWSEQPATISQDAAETGRLKIGGASVDAGANPHAGVVECPADCPTQESVSAGRPLGICTHKSPRRRPRW